MKYQLLRTSPYLGGQIRWDIPLHSSYNEGVHQVSANELHIVPLNDDIAFNQDNSRDCFKYTHPVNVANLYKQIGDAMFSADGEYSSIHWLNNAGDLVDPYSNKYIMGAKRMRYQRYHKQFSFLCPLWISEQIDPKDLYFVLSVGVAGEERDHIARTIIRLGDNVADYMYKYLSKSGIYFNPDPANPTSMEMWQGVSDDLLNIKFDPDQAYITGVNVVDGLCMVKDVSYVVSNLLHHEQPLMEFDNLLLSLFRTQKMVAQQLINLNFVFDLEDISFYLKDELLGQPITLTLRVGYGDPAQEDTLLPLKDLYTDYNHIPVWRADHQVFSTSNYVTEYMGDDKMLNYVHANKFTQPIFHWTMVENPKYIYNFYDGFAPIFNQESGDEPFRVSGRYFDQADIASPEHTTYNNAAYWCRLDDLSLINPNMFWQYMLERSENYTKFNEFSELIINRDSMIAYLNNNRYDLTKMDKDIRDGFFEVLERNGYNKILLSNILCPQQDDIWGVDAELMDEFNRVLAEINIVDENEWRSYIPAGIYNPEDPPQGEYYIRESHLDEQNIDIPEEHLPTYELVVDWAAIESGTELYTKAPWDPDWELYANDDPIHPNTYNALRDNRGLGTLTIPIIEENSISIYDRTNYMGGTEDDEEEEDEIFEIDDDMIEQNPEDDMGPIPQNDPFTPYHPIVIETGYKLSDTVTVTVNDEQMRRYLDEAYIYKAKIEDLLVKYAKQWAELDDQTEEYKHQRDLLEQDADILHDNIAKYYGWDGTPDSFVTFKKQSTDQYSNTIWEDWLWDPTTDKVMVKPDDMEQYDWNDSYSLSRYEAMYLIIRSTLYNFSIDPAIDLNNPDIYTEQLDYVLNNGTDGYGYDVIIMIQNWHLMNDEINKWINLINWMESTIADEPYPTDDNQWYERPEHCSYLNDGICKENFDKILEAYEWMNGIQPSYNYDNDGHPQIEEEDEIELDLPNVPGIIPLYEIAMQILNDYENNINSMMHQWLSDVYDILGDPNHYIDSSQDSIPVLVQTDNESTLLAFSPINTHIAHATLYQLYDFVSKHWQMIDDDVITGLDWVVSVLQPGLVNQQDWEICMRFIAYLFPCWIPPYRIVFDRGVAVSGLDYMIDEEKPQEFNAWYVPNHVELLRYTGKLIPLFINPEDEYFKNFNYRYNQWTNINEPKVQKYNKQIASGLEPFYPSIGYFCYADAEVDTLMERPSWYDEYEWPWEIYWKNAGKIYELPTVYEAYTDATEPKNYNDTIEDDMMWPLLYEYIALALEGHCSGVVNGELTLWMKHKIKDLYEITYDFEYESNTSLLVVYHVKFKLR